MRRQRPLRYTLALFAVGVVASPAARAAADDGAGTAPTLAAREPEASAAGAPADESGHGSEAPPDTRPETEPEPSTPSTTTPPPTTTPTTTPPPTTTPTTTPAPPTTTTQAESARSEPTTPVTTETAPPAATGGAPVRTLDDAVDPPTPTLSDTTSTPDVEDVDGPAGIDGVTRPITFPVLGPVSYSNSWGACRDGCARHHQGTDIMGVRMQPLLAAADGTVTRVRLENAGIAGVVISVTGEDGWYYNYFHVNDDTPGTDDGLAGPQWQISPGLTVGSRVRAGQVIGYMGDSGNAESSVPHLHFEIRTPEHTPANPYPSLVAAQRRETCVGGAAWTNAALGTLSPSAVAVIPLAGGRWVIDRDGRLHAEGSAARVQPAAGVACDHPVPRAPVAVPVRQAAPPVPSVAAPADVERAGATGPAEVPVPVDAPLPVDAAVPAPDSPTTRRWTVEPGDCLWDIVQAAYGTSAVDATVALVDFVFEHNRDQLTSPSVLHAGTTLELPPLMF